MQLKKYLKNFQKLNLLIIIFFLVSCRTVDDDAVTSVDFEPEVGSTESNLWMEFEIMEEKTKTSPYTIKDKELNDYVKKVFCKLQPDYCQKIRIYITRIPAFNATMAGNGFMEIWSGALLHLENEAQLAAVIGHEFGHYFYRHSIKGYEQRQGVKAITNVFNIASMLGSAYIQMNPYGMYNYDIFSALQIGSIGVHLAQMSIFAYSRGQETEADIYGLECIIKSGYHADEAPNLWEKLTKSQKLIGNNPNYFHFTRTHPTNDQRIKDLRDKIKELNPDQTAFIGQKEFNQVMSKFREQWVKDDLTLGNLKKSKFLIESLKYNKDLPGEKDFFMGEYYKALHFLEKNKKKKEEYHKKIVRHLKISTESDTEFAPPLLSLGSYLIKNNPEEGRKYLKKFVDLKPDNPYSKLIKMEFLE
tara:strand:+ start:871 stop:2118 length:1248 start_codon:yes stop_codon:yes gene_type:complete